MSVKPNSRYEKRATNKSQPNFVYESQRKNISIKSVQSVERLRIPDHAM